MPPHSNVATAALTVAMSKCLRAGVYPLFIKTDAVLKAKPHPVVFQLYKSSCVFLSGFIFLIPRYFSWKNRAGQ